MQLFFNAIINIYFKIYQFYHIYLNGIILFLNIKIIIKTKIIHAYIYNLKVYLRFNNVLVQQIIENNFKIQLCTFLLEVMIIMLILPFMDHSLIFK